MNKILIKYILCGYFSMFCILPCHAFIDGIINVLKGNYKTILLSYTNENDTLLKDLIQIKPEIEVADQAVFELQQRYPFDLEKLSGYLSSITEEGAWPDINYQDTKRSGWEPKKHADRILELAKLYCSPNTVYFRSEKVWQGISQALHYWYRGNFVCTNWWYNQIGIPRTLGEAFILIEDKLSEKEKEEAIRVMQSSRLGMTGQNKIWLAGNVLIRALLENNSELVKVAHDAIISEITLGKDEGIKEDWSFHQHGAQLQFGNYGLSFITSMSFFSQLFRGTNYQFGKREMGILSSFVENGYQWVIWHRYMDINALGRQLFHNVPIHKAYGVAFASTGLGLKDGFPTMTNSLTGHKHFYCSNYAVHRSQYWMASVRMSSSRVLGTELTNEDNLKGYYLGDGATYYYRQGDEYLNVFPFWDWRKIPGVTAYEDAAPLPNINRKGTGNQSNRVGGLSNGSYGMASMELNRDGLNAYKAWVFTDEFVVCMGTGIKADTLLEVTTSIEQCLKKEDLLLWNHKKWLMINGEKRLCGRDLRFFHNRMGYIILSRDTCVAETQKRKGRWHDFMGMYRPASVAGEVMSLHLRHGICPEQAGYLYLVLPNVGQDDVECFNVDKEVRVVQNNQIAQIISLPKQKCHWATVYVPGEITIEGQKIRVNESGIYYLEKKDGELNIKLWKAFN